MSEYDNIDQQQQESSLDSINNTISQTRAAASQIKSAKENIDRAKEVIETAKAAKAMKGMAAIKDIATAAANPYVAAAKAAIALISNPEMFKKLFLFIAIPWLINLGASLMIILFIGFGTVSQTGLNQRAQSLDLLAYEDIVCDAYEEYYSGEEDKWPELCITIKENSATEADVLSLRQNPRDQFLIFVLSLKEQAEKEYSTIIDFLSKYKNAYHEVLKEPKPKAPIHVYLYEGKYYRAKDFDTSFISSIDDGTKEYENRSDINPVKGDEWKLDFQKFRDHDDLADGTGGKLFTLEDIAEVYAAYTVSTGDSFPVIAEEDSSKKSIMSYVTDYTKNAYAATGTFYNAMTKITMDDIVVQYNVHELDLKEGSKTTSTTGCKRATNAPPYAVCENLPYSYCKNYCTWGPIEETKKVYKLVETSNYIQSEDSHAFKLHEVMTPFRTRIISTLIITNNKYQDNSTGLSTLFYKYQMDKLGISNFENPHIGCLILATAKSKKYLLSLGAVEISNLLGEKYQKTIDEKIEDLLANGQTSGGVRDIHENAYFDCMDEQLRKLTAKSDNLLTNAPFYRYQPVYYHECGHPPDGYETCHHTVSDGKGGAEFCGEEIDMAYNSLGDALLGSISNLIGWIGDHTGVGLFNGVSTYISNSWVKEHPLYTYDRLVERENTVDDEGVSHIANIAIGAAERDDVNKADLFNNGVLWEIPANESIMDEVLSPDHSTTSESQTYYTIAEKLQLYTGENIAMLEKGDIDGHELVIDKFLEAPSNLFHSDSVCRLLQPPCLSGFNCFIFAQNHSVSTLVWDKVNSIRKLTLENDWPYHQCVAYVSGLFQYTYGFSDGEGNGIHVASNIAKNHKNSFNLYKIGTTTPSSSSATPLSSSAEDFVKKVNAASVVSSAYKNNTIGHVLWINWTGWSYTKDGEVKFVSNEKTANSLRAAGYSLTPVVIFSDGNMDGHGGTRNHITVEAKDFISAYCSGANSSGCDILSPKTTSLFQGGLTGAKTFDELGSFDYVTGTKNSYDSETMKCRKSACQIQASAEENCH